LLVVPVVASLTVITGYLRRRILGLSPFEDDGSQQFVAPPEVVNPRRRRLTNKVKKKKEMDETASDSSKPVSPSPAESHLDLDPDQ
jgi:hypothetical protein